MRAASPSISWILAACVIAGAAAPQAMAQTQPQPPGPDGCPDTAAAVAPSTPPAQGAGSETAPGGDGSTGWTGGTGGSHIGTSPAGPTAASPNDQPETASGLDPAAGGNAQPAC